MYITDVHRHLDAREEFVKINEEDFLRQRKSRVYRLMEFFTYHPKIVLLPSNWLGMLSKRRTHIS